jgi:transcriptional regulator with XRE-family HTH domain
MIGDDSELRQLVMEAGVNAHIAELIRDARMAAGLTQTKLAKLIGAKRPVIARLEDADYRGNSLAMLQRIAAALHQRLELRFVPSAAQHPRRLQAMKPVSVSAELCAFCNDHPNNR